MIDIKRTAQLMLVAEYKNLGIEPQACALMAQGHQPGGVHHAAVQAIIAALTPPAGYVLVPVEPTDRMIGEGILAYDGKCESSYAAMIAARPEVK